MFKCLCEIIGDVILVCGKNGMVLIECGYDLLMFV